MSQNEIKIKATLDQTQLEREAEQMTRTMEKMYERSYSSSNNIRQQQILNQNLGRIGLPQTGAAQGAFQNATATGDSKFRQEVQEQLKLIEKQREMVKRHSDEITRMRSEQDKAVKGSAQHLSLEEKITKQKENQVKLEMDLSQRQENLNKVFKQRQQSEQTTSGKITEGFANGGLRGGLKSGVEAIGGSEAALGLGVAGAAMYAIRQITNVAEAIVREVASVSRVTNTASGNAIAGSTGNYLSQVYGGRSVFETGNAGERARALGGAMKEEGRTRGFESFAAGDTGGMAVNPDMHMLGLGYGALNATFGGDNQRSRFLGRFSDSQMQKYNAMSTERMVRNYQENMESNKNQDPMKQLALSNYEGTHNRDLDVQRKLGLGDGAMYGSSGFMRNYINQGFTNEQGMGSMNNIIAAGGSTRMARDPSSSLQMGRQFDLTNSDSVMGKLSGNYGDPNKAKSATIEILAEGMRQGLNKSEFREEQRKFTEAAASFLARGYAGSDSDMERQAGMFGNGLNAKTGVGIQSASNAADIVAEVSAQGTGPEGALGFSSLLSSKTGKKLSDQSQQSLNTMDIKDVTAYNPRIISMAQEAGVTPQEIIDLKMDSVKNKLFRNKDVQALTEQAVSDRDLHFAGKSNAEIGELSKNDPIAKAVMEKLGKAQNSVANAYGISGNQNLLDSVTDALGHFGNPNYHMKDDARDFLSKQGGQNRLGDKTNAGIANDQGIVLDKTNSMLGDFNSMADVSKKMSGDMVNAMLKIQEITNSLKGLSGPEYEAELKKRVQNAGNIFSSAATKPGNQPQGGKH